MCKNHDTKKGSKKVKRTAFSLTNRDFVIDECNISFASNKGGSGGLLNKFNRPKVKVLLYKYKGLNGAQFVVCGRKEKFGNITK